MKSLKSNNNLENVGYQSLSSVKSRSHDVPSAKIGFSVSTAAYFFLCRTVNYYFYMFISSFRYESGAIAFSFLTCYAFIKEHGKHAAVFWEETL